MRTATPALALIVAIAACGHAAAPAGPGGGAPGLAGPVVVLDYEPYLGLIFLPVDIAGKGARPMLLDSGWHPSSIDQDVAAELGIHTSNAETAAAPGGDIEMATADAFDLHLGALAFTARDADVVPLHPLAQIIGRSFDGILGDDLFEKYVVEIDYAQHKLTLWQPESYVVPKGGEVLPLEVVAGEPFVHATIVVAGVRHDAKLKIDTGSTGGLGLNGSYVKGEALIPEGAPKVTFVGAAVGGRTKDFAARADELVLGGVRVPKPIATYSEDESRTGDAGTLGAEVLQHFTVIFDHAHQRLVLVAAGPIAPEPWDNFGFQVAATDATLREVGVTEVSEQSPAAEAGLAPGDVITKVDGAAPTPAGLMMRLRAPGTMKVTVRREGGERELTLVGRVLL